MKAEMRGKRLQNPCPAVLLALLGRALQAHTAQESKADNIPTAKRECDAKPAGVLNASMCADWLTGSAKLRGTYRGI